MLIHSKERLETLFEAQQELAELRRGEIPESFFRDKIARAWERARSSPAYCDLGEFSWPAFTALKPTGKDRLKAEPWSFVATDLKQSVKYYETTGTTSRVTPTPRLAEDIIWNVTSVALAWQDIVDGDDRVLSLLPSDVVPVGDLVAGVSEYLGAPHARAYPFAAGISDWDRLIGLWTTLRPTAVFLAPGVALQATRLLKQRGLLEEMSEPVRSLMLLGEVSVPALRARLGQWWNADVYDASYGSTETGTLAAACRNDRLHLLTSANYFEFAADGGPVPLPESGSGRLVVTPLNLHARPLLRYDTGDEVALGEPCDCGRATPVVEVLGRATDGLRHLGNGVSPRAVEEVVYSATTATGYLLETDPEGRRARLLLEREAGADRAAEPGMCEAVQAASRERLGLAWDQVAFVNTLPSTTKSGGSQKNWKRSNIRIVEAQ